MMRGVSWRVIGVVLLLAGCGGSPGSGSLGSGSLGSGSLGSGPGAAAEGADGAAETRPTAAAVIDGAVRLERITTAVLEPTLRGAILRVEGVAPVPGYHSARLNRLVAVPDQAPAEDEEPRGPAPVLRFDLRAVPPDLPSGAGSERLRTITTALFLTRAQLEGVERIEVIAQTNSVALRP